MKYEPKKRKIEASLVNYKRFVNNRLARILVKNQKPYSTKEGHLYVKQYKKFFKPKNYNLKQKKKPIPTTHSKFKFAERFKAHGYTFQQIVDDVTKGRTSVKLMPTGKFSVRGHLGTYIIDREYRIITMYIEQNLLDKISKC